MNTQPISQKTYLIGIALLTILALSVFALQSATHPAEAQTGTFSFTALGDIGANGTDTNASMASVASSGSVFSIALGDMMYQELATETQWCDYIKSYVGATFPFELISGNHDADGSSEGFIGNFAACLPDRMASTGTYGVEYYFDYNNLRVIGTAPNLTINGIFYDYNIVGGTHYNWVRDRIREAKAAGKWVVVGMHEACISTGTQGCQIGENFMDLLIAEGVDIILQAHDHTYQRSKQLVCADPNVYLASCVADDGSDNLYNRGAGTVFIFSGAAGGWHMFNVSTNDSEAGYFSKIAGASKGYNLVTGQTYSAGNGITKFTVSTNQIDVQYLPFGGTFSDSFSIVSGGPTATPAPPTSTPTPTPTPPPGSVVMHVADMLTTDANGNPQTSFIKNSTVYWKVKIVDANNVPVSGATVNTDALNSSNEVKKSTSATTGADGWTTLMSWNTPMSVWPGTYSIKVTNVTKTSGVYNPGANVVTQIFFNIPS